MVILTAFAGPADAQIKSLIMPGKVVEGHAEFEQDCEACHAAFERSKQKALCLDCHEDIAGDVDASAGFHGLSNDARQSDCADCHTDHEGRDADIAGLNRATFNHEFTDFALTGKHTDTLCESCHVPDVKFRDTPQDCYSCHEADNVHHDAMGTECGDCHSPTGWLDVEFDHDTTGFGLIGKHLDAACDGCHEDQTFQNTPTTCFGCHAEDDVHKGRSGQECQNCHSPLGWDDTSFDHARDTDFPLDGKHEQLTCNDCHSDDPFSDQLETACVSCHLEDDNHDAHFGSTCDTCHVSSDWALIAFDHDTDTGHALRGAHESITCEDCHVEPIFDVALQTGCNSCHAEDDPHEGTQGTQCQDCHNEIAWPDDVFFDHGLTRFPLLGSHTDTECDACHQSKVFNDAPMACVDCHLEDDSHDGRFDSGCARCHNPVDWLQWQFDHDLQTDFVLDGAHAVVACENCHRRPLSMQQKLGNRCGDCHRADDVHDGEFGYDCGRCHTADNFTDVRSIQ